MKLHGSYSSPYVRHCRIVLQETLQSYEFIETDMVGSASRSPALRVPFLEDGEVFLSDSTSIVSYLRRKAGQVFCESPERLDRYCLVNTALDSSLNLFFLKRDGVDVTHVPYLQRQQQRVQSVVQQLNTLTLPTNISADDADLRLACFIGWAKFRQQVNFSQYPALESFYAWMQDYAPFVATEPK
jgi:glutathione S-transferase